MLRIKSAVLQIGLHVIRGDLPMMVLCNLVDSFWEPPPGVTPENFLVHFMRGTLQAIWLHHASGASPAGLVVMHVPARPDAALLRGLEKRLRLVRNDPLSLSKVLAARSPMQSQIMITRRQYAVLFTRA